MKLFNQIIIFLSVMNCICAMDGPYVKALEQRAKEFVQTKRKEIHCHPSFSKNLVLLLQKIAEAERYQFLRGGILCGLVSQSAMSLLIEPVVNCVGETVDVWCYPEAANLCIAEDAMNLWAYFCRSIPSLPLHESLEVFDKDSRLLAITFENIKIFTRVVSDELGIRAEK